MGLKADESPEITQILAELDSTDQKTAFATLLPLVYNELRALSGKYLRRERPDHTLQATALVHEAYVRLAGSPEGRWENRAHFFRVAAKVMRRILINHALAHSAEKRGGQRTRVSMTDLAEDAGSTEFDLLDLHEAMERLAVQDRHKARVVELRFFAGCTIEETAEVLGVSTATVERDWRFARAWLRSQLDAHQPG